MNATPQLRIEDQRVAPSRVPQHPYTRPASGPVLRASNARSSTGGSEAKDVVKQTTNRKLLTYQLAAVVSAVLAGTESQLLLFFKTSSNFSHAPAPSTLQCLLILTYTALLFSISSTISALVLTENFGDSLGITRRLRKTIRKYKVGKRLISRRPTHLAELAHTSTPRRWRLMEYHWLLTLVVSVLCLVMQIFVYIWTQEGVIVKAVVAALGIFAVFPLLHFLPIRWKARHVIQSVEDGPTAPVPPQVPDLPDHVYPPAPVYDSPVQGIPPSGPGTS